MTRRGYFIRLAFSIVYDLFDLILFWIPGLGTITDGVGTVMLLALWGPAGLVNVWEIVNPVDPIDAFVPTATLVALFIGWREGFLFGRRGSSGESRDVARGG